MSTPPLSVAFWLTVIPVSIYALYRYFLPKPIPGVPYNPEAARSIFGDAPSLLHDKGDVVNWILSQTRRHPGPLCQLFLKPFGKPIVILTDFRESQDILMHRKEWDRSDTTIELLSGQDPFHHINLKTNATWKAHRRLLQDLMTPAFLHSVAAPNLYASVLNLVELWEVKTLVAGTRPFTAERDIYHAALDAVLDFTFGDSYPHRATPPQTKLARSISDGRIREIRSGATDKPVEFGLAPLDESLDLILHSTDWVKVVIRSPCPGLHWKLINMLPSQFMSIRKRHAFVRSQIKTAVKRLESQDISGDGDQDWVNSAVDHMMHREKRAAEKENRKPVYISPVMEQEIFGFIVAGHDTSSTTLLWALKLLSDNEAVQTKVRDALRTAHSAALAERRMPSVEEIIRTQIPYLDAVIEEILRCGGTVPMVDRSCDQDTVILGHHIPKGTTVIMPNRGPSFTEPARKVDESLRSPTAKRDRTQHGGARAWDPEGMDVFRPERWLVAVFDEKKGTQEEVFDATAGPTMPFGLGTRGCFGRRLAYLQQRTTLSLLLWNFELLPSVPELSSYAAASGLTNKPLQCYVRLRRTGLVAGRS